MTLLKQHGYVQADNTDHLFKHITRDISFTLVVDDFLIKYVNKDNVHHLMKIIQERYTFKVDFNLRQSYLFEEPFSTRKHLPVSDKIFVEYITRTQTMYCLVSQQTDNQEHSTSLFDRAFRFFFGKYWYVCTMYMYVAVSDATIDGMCFFINTVITRKITISRHIHT